VREIKFRITYQHDETEKITQRDIELGQPIPRLGKRWDVIAKNQYTGLKDKDGKEMYEGDVVKISWHDKGQNKQEQISVISWNGNGYGNVYDNHGYIKEIIGNIYENPELL